MNKQVDLSVDIAGIHFRTPITTASGTFGFGQEYAALTDLHQLGAITVKGITPEPRQGNPGQRLIETPAGLINSVGLMNPGVEAFLSDDLPWLLQQDVPLIVNINGKTAEEYGEMAARLDQVAGIAALEVNISCPNVKEGGMAFGIKPETAAAAVRAARQHTNLPLIVKLSPNVTDIALMAKVVEAEGADVISLINTILAMVIDLKQRKPVLANTFGGLSGPAIRPIALRMVYQVYQAVRLPIIGMGGIMTAEDALSFLMAGASVIALGTANFVEPDSIGQVAAGLTAWCQKEKVSAIREIIGCAHR
ncbi:MAG: dihydroorotate dehydrogenase [Negativicutes bacterium]|nr:dihydroorotate dehydrogenase [Negativicutes bacterium]